MAKFQERFAVAYECAKKVKEQKISVKETQAEELMGLIPVEVLKAFEKLISERLDPNKVSDNTAIDRIVLTICLAQMENKEWCIYIVENKEDKKAEKIYYEWEVTDIKDYINMVRIQKKVGSIVNPEGAKVEPVIQDDTAKKMYIERGEILSRFNCIVEFC